jgi:L-fucono-1,5-lactonase
LTCDLLIHPRHLPAALELVEQFPEQPLVLDQMAKPFIKDGTLSPWENQIRRLAQAPHGCCKVSGLVTEARWKGWRPEDFKPYLDVVFEAFGEDWLMFGSGWPVCLLAAGYEEAVDLVKGYLNSFSSIAKKKVFGVNAARFYGMQ